MYLFFELLDVPGLGQVLKIIKVYSSTTCLAESLVYRYMCWLFYKYLHHYSPVREELWLKTGDK